MALFEKMKDSISMAGQEVAQKTKNATENVRIGNQIKANEKMIEKLTYQVGVQCVKNYIEEENSEYAELFAEILRLRAENQACQAELQKLTAVNVCPQCGMANKTTAKFCVGCGAPITAAPVTPAAPVEGKKCPNCGNVNEKDAMFCVECGTPLPEVTEDLKDVEEALEETLEEVMEETPANVCKACGAAMTDDMLFCVQCGTKRE